MVEHVTLTPDGLSVIYSANTGADTPDIDRRHLFKVPVSGSSVPQQVTGGATLEWAPVVTADGQTLAFLQSSPQRPALPAVMPMAGGPARTIGAGRPCNASTSRVSHACNACRCRPSFVRTQYTNCAMTIALV